MTRTIQILRGTTAQNNAFTGAAGELTMDTTRKELRVHDGSTVGGKVVSLTPGFIAPFAGSTAPDGWLICDGSAVSRTTYADLFAVIGTTYGTGDGNSTFNLPNYTYARLLTGTAVDVYGNGMTIGVFSNGVYGGMGNHTGGSTGVWQTMYGKPDSTAVTGAAFQNSRTMSITSDASKSGIVGSIKYSTPLKMCIKY